MQTIEALRRRIGNAEDLLSVVKTMKTLAAVNTRQYERAVESLEEYNRAVQMGLHIVLRAQETNTIIDRPVANHRLGVVVFGSDQGLCGQFNERIATFSVEQLNTIQPPPEHLELVAVGVRPVISLEEAGYLVTHQMSVPGGLVGITPTVQELLLLIEQQRMSELFDRVLLFHNRPFGGAAYAPTQIQLLPVDLNWLRSLEAQRWPSRLLPTFTMEPDKLFAALIRQTMFVSLSRACAESLMSEEISRLASMQNAERNIEERLEELNMRYHHQRQNLITAELLDIIAGYEAVTGAV
jgi:F-type H+-transporting ATPase subunit gamma